MAQDIVALGINLDDKTRVLEFFNNKMAEKKIGLDKRIGELASDWSIVQSEVAKRLKDLFRTDLDLGNITVYLTVSKRCGYNHEKNFFFVTIDGECPRKTIIHELLHFYTHKLYENDLKSQGVDNTQFNDYKEALTFLVNTNFSDIVSPAKDFGYEKQKELRKYLEHEWRNCRDVGELTEKYKKYLIQLK